MLHPGEDRLLLHQTGACPGRTRKRSFERAVQSVDPVRHIDVAKIPAPKVFEPCGSNSPCIDESTQIGVWITHHYRYIV